MNNDEVIDRWAKNRGNPGAKAKSYNRRFYGADLYHWSTLMARFVRNERNESAVEILESYPSVTSTRLLNEARNAISRAGIPIFNVTFTSHAPTEHKANLESYIERFELARRAGCYNNRDATLKRKEAEKLADEYNRYNAFYSLTYKPLYAEWPEEYVAARLQERRKESNAKAAETRARTILRMIDAHPLAKLAVEEHHVAPRHIPAMLRTLNKLENAADDDNN